VSTPIRVKEERSTPTIDRVRSNVEADFSRTGAVTDGSSAEYLLNLKFFESSKFNRSLTHQSSFSHLHRLVHTLTLS